MYPKVKVREEEQDDDQYTSLDSDGSCCWSLDALESLSILNSPVHDFEDDTPTVVRVPKSYIALSSMPTEPVSKGIEKNNDEIVVDDNKPNLKASPVLRPRAVLSSPDNDAMIRSQNKKCRELLSGLKSHNKCQNRHTQCKVVPGNDVAESLITTKRESSTAASDVKTDVKGRKGSAKVNPSPRGGHTSKGKPRTS